MKVYIAGKLHTKEEIETLEKIDSICKSLNFKTFLPHRDVGLAKDIKDINKIFEGDIIQGFKDVSLIIASLEGLHVGAGTAWELGYAYAKDIPSIALKTDEPKEEAFEYLSSIILASTPIATSFKELESWLKQFKDKNER
jgi:nucleoside 2-deoxyribosyltransferase